MNDEERPPGGRDGQAPEQVRAPGNPESSQPIDSYPPPTGSPFVHPVPPPMQGLEGAGAPTSAPTHTFEHNVGKGGNAERSGQDGQDGHGGLGGGVISAIVGGAIAIAMVAALFGGIVGAFLVSRSDGGSSALPPAPAGSTVRPKGSIADIASRVLPSVVTIKVEGPGVAGTGSGFVMRADGYIVTNNHVVEPAAKGKITVLFPDGKSSGATVVGRDDSYDMAVLRVSRRNLPALVLGSSSAVRVGDPVLAVGAPLGLDGTVTSGIVSALNRPVTAGGAGATSASFINAIQTDAAINPGNSGGPLLDLAGRVIGVNSAIARVAGTGSSDGQSGNIGVGFAIPSDQVRKTAEQLIASGKATHPVIGVLIDTTYKGVGVRIASSPQKGNPPITKGGPADRAGLRPGDVIVRFDGRPVTGTDEFVVAIRAKSVGDTVQLTVRQGSAERTVKMTLQAAN